jgi:hypothetical protein
LEYQELEEAPCKISMAEANEQLKHQFYGMEK